MELVVSRFNESLEWMKEPPFCFHRYTVYNKGPATGVSAEVLAKYVSGGQMIPLPNVGREGHTYLAHIVSRVFGSASDDTPPILVCLPGSVNLPHKRAVAIALLTRLSAAPGIATIYANHTDLTLQDYFRHFVAPAYRSSSLENVTVNPEIQTQLADIRPFGAWFDTEFTSSSSAIYHDWCLYGVFSVHRDDILQHPRQRYERLLAQLAVGSNPEVGHFMERSWVALFSPLHKTAVLPMDTVTKTTAKLFGEVVSSVMDNMMRSSTETKAVKDMAALPTRTKKQQQQQSASRITPAKPPSLPLPLVTARPLPVPPPPPVEEHSADGEHSAMTSVIPTSFVKRSSAGLTSALMVTVPELPVLLPPPPPPPPSSQQHQHQHIAMPTQVFVTPRVSLDDVSAAMPTLLPVGVSSLPGDVAAEEDGIPGGVIDTKATAAFITEDATMTVHISGGNEGGYTMEPKRSLTFQHAQPRPKRYRRNTGGAAGSGDPSFRLHTTEATNAAVVVVPRKKMYRLVQR